MDTSTVKMVSPYSAAMIGEHTVDRHSEAREKFRQEAKVVSSYMKTLHPHRKDGHLQLNYPSTIRRLNQNSAWSPDILTRNASSLPPSMATSSGPVPMAKAETGIFSSEKYGSSTNADVSEQAARAYGEHESIYFSREPRQLQEATIQ